MTNITSNQLPIINKWRVWTLRSRHEAMTQGKKKLRVFNLSSRHKAREG